MKYIIIWKDNPIPGVINETYWNIFGEKIRHSENIVAIHVYDEDGCWDSDVNMELK